MSYQRDIGDKAGRERTDCDAGDEVADQRRHAEAVCQRAEDERQYQTSDDGRDQRGVMGHGAWCPFFFNADGA